MLLMLKGLFLMLNNKGQSLILFVIVLPILLLVLILVLDLGKVIIKKNELNNINDIVMDFGLSNLDSDNLEEELVDLIMLNKDDIDNIDVNIVDDKIYITLNDKVNCVFASIVDISIFDINLSYVGYIDGDVKRIERMGV